MKTTQTTSHTIDLIASAEKANCLLASATQDPQAQHVFMRELGQSALDHFQWFYLLTTLLALKDQPQVNAQLPQAAAGVTA